MNARTSQVPAPAAPAPAAVLSAAAPAPAAPAPAAVLSAAELSADTFEGAMGMGEPDEVGGPTEKSEPRHKHRRRGGAKNTKK